jgi:hypothetical protein
MINKSSIILIVLFSLSLVSAVCEEDQIDINSASLEELDEIIWVGPATAPKIVDARPFGSVDDLIEVSGIGDVKLQAIKDEGLACVEASAEVEIVEEPEDDEDIIFEEIKDDGEEVEEVLERPQVIKPPIITEVELIDLTKDIKTDKDSEILDKSNYALYGFVGFCVLIASLFILRRKRFSKNEFN